MAPGERMEVADTPALERSQIPYAAYQAPAPFDLDQTGLLWITPIDLRKPRDEQALQLEGHCTPRFTLTSVREGYPGRHLIAGHANRAATRLRRLASSPLLLGGWPLYVADLMWEMGFYTMDPLTRLLQLQDLLLASTRVVVDTGLHTNRMTYEEGCAYLVETAGIDEGRARFEVRRIAMTPTRASGAMLGHLSIVELRQELSQLQGGKHDMHEFHGALLSAGALPPALLREEICERLGVPSSLPR